MNNEYFQQIYRTLDLKETDELLEIWKRNDREEWTDEALKAIEIILTNRLKSLPEKYTVEESNVQSIKLTVAKEENPTVYYLPRKVIRLCQIMDIAAPISVIAFLISNYQILYQQVFSLFQPYDDKTGVIIQFVLLLLTLFVNCVLLYFVLRVFSSILRILLQIADNSLKNISENLSSSNL
jgi:hypothetical protein